MGYQDNNKNLEERIDTLEQASKQIQADIERIKERNLRVEADKAWETSWIRRLAIVLITYLAASALMHALGSRQALLDALIPSGAYLLSVLTIPALKQYWLARRSENQQ
ncbi:MAG: hypothetical protein AB7W16_16865 [Candidatus Obscuribacterales bacterium]